MTTRRSFLTRSSSAVAALAVADGRGRLRPIAPFQTTRTVDPANRIETDPVVRTLALRAIDAAKAAGATYADVRLTRTLQAGATGFNMLYWGAPGLNDIERYGIGVRALVNGYWGFAASPYWTPDDAVLLARQAVAQAKSNALGTTRPADLGTTPVVTGSWATPVRIDPFTVTLEEREEYLGSIVETCRQAIREYPMRYDASRSWGRWLPGVALQRQERAIATSDGSYVTQTTYSTTGGFVLSLTDVRTGRMSGADARGLGTQALGWEMILDADVPGQIPRMIAEAEEKMHWISKPGDVGRYDVVFDAAAMAEFLNGTLGVATQLDRALGYEANADGTSYLDDPFGMLGSYQVGAPLLTVTANRSAPGQLATVKWDDEGVTPEEFTLVQDGALVDFQTTREQASWLKDYYQKAGKPVRSHGCAAADDALSITMQHMPNLRMAPGPDDLSFDDLVRNTKQGFAVTGVQLQMDWQGRSGVGGGLVREIVNGRLGNVIVGLGFLFTSDEIWKNISAVGGSRSAVAIAVGDQKGQPAQQTFCTVSAVPAKVKNVTFVRPPSPEGR